MEEGEEFVGIGVETEELVVAGGAMASRRGLFIAFNSG